MATSLSTDGLFHYAPTSPTSPIILPSIIFLSTRNFHLQQEAWQRTREAPQLCFWDNTLGLHLKHLVLPSSVCPTRITKRAREEAERPEHFPCKRNEISNKERVFTVHLTSHLIRILDIYNISLQNILDFFQFLMLYSIFALCVVHPLIFGDLLRFVNESFVDIHTDRHWVDI